VGKTSILLRYVRGEYSDKQQSTLQASYLDKRLVAAGTSTHLSIWDTAGQERFHSLGPIYYRDAGEKSKEALRATLVRNQGCGRRGL
jgi:Ras-related protein Rab-21